MKFEEIYKKVLDADKKFKEQGIPINLDFKIEDLRDALIESFETLSSINAERDALRKENAYLRMLAAKSISRIYRMRYSMAWIGHPFENGRKKERYEKWIDKFVDLYRKAKKEFENLKGM